jgi:hypothetical protein
MNLKELKKLKKLMLNLLFNKFSCSLWCIWPQSGQPNGIDRFTLLESGTYQLKVLTDNGIVLLTTDKLKKDRRF